MDVTEGPHEDRLEGVDHAGKEGWCVKPSYRAIEFHGQAHDVPGADKGTPELARGISAPSATSHYGAASTRIVC